jgi:XkdW protein
VKVTIGRGQKSSTPSEDLGRQLVSEKLARLQMAQQNASLGKELVSLKLQMLKLGGV